MDRSKVGAACAVALLLVGFLAVGPQLKNFSQYGVWPKVIAIASLLFCFCSIAGTFWYVNQLETKVAKLNKVEQELQSANESVQSLSGHLLRRHDEELALRVEMAKLRADLGRAEKLLNFWMPRS